MSSREFSCNVRGGKLDKGPLSSRPWFIAMARVCIDTICSFPVIDVRQEDSWEYFWIEKESNMDAVIKGKEEEGERSNLKRRWALVSVCLTRIKGTEESNTPG
jgi:hypothetical protein